MRERPAREPGRTPGEAVDPARPRAAARSSSSASDANQARPVRSGIDTVTVRLSSGRRLTVALPFFSSSILEAVREDCSSPPPCGRARRATDGRRVPTAAGRWSLEVQPIGVGGRADAA